MEGEAGILEQRVEPVAIGRRREDAQERVRGEEDEEEEAEADHALDGEHAGPEARRQAAEQLLPQIPTPRRLALMDATMSDELAAFRRQRSAVEAFYNRLTPEQQRDVISRTFHGQI